MVLKKINGACSWLLCLALLGHLATMSYSMFTGWYDLSVCKSLSRLTACIIVIHIAISLIILCFVHDSPNFKYYLHHNIKTILQRATGLVIIALLHLHVNAFGFIVSGETLSAATKAGILITEIIFFESIFLHLAIAFTKSLINFGLIRGESTERAVDRIAYVICAILFILTCSSLIFFVTTWTGFAG